MQKFNWFTYIPKQHSIGNLRSPTSSKTAVNVHNLIEDAVARYIVEARQKSIHLGLEGQTGKAIVWGDEQQLVEMIDVMIRNALNQTLEGYIKVHLEESAAYYGLTVIDSGLGIGPDQNIFHTTKEFKGRPCRIMHITDPTSKLGSIKDLVSAHQGYLELSVEPGVGTARRLWLPAISQIEMTKGSYQTDLQASKQ